MKLYLSEPVLRLVFHGHVKRVINEPETSGPSTTEMGLEPEESNALLILDFVHGGKLLGEIFLGNATSTRVDDIDDLIKT